MSANLVAPTAAWESRTTVRRLPVVGILVADPAGGWMLDTDKSVTADGYLAVDSNGGVHVDDAAISGLATRVVGRAVLAY